MSRLLLRYHRPETSQFALDQMHRTAVTGAQTYGYPQQIPFARQRADNWRTISDRFQSLLWVS
jgi:hypothetical protein